MGNTKQRQKIFELLSASAKHLTAEQIFEQARLVFPNLGRGTVYRNLNLMADEGVIRRVHIPGQPVLFDANIKPHQHMVCMTCGGILDIGNLAREEMRKLIEPGTEIIDYFLVMYAICGKCAGKI